jgi:hypothetical protein
MRKLFLLCLVSLPLVARADPYPYTPNSFFDRAQWDQFFGQDAASQRAQIIEQLGHIQDTLDDLEEQQLLNDGQCQEDGE